MAFQASSEERFDRLDDGFSRLERKIDSKIDGFAKALPVIVGDELRQALREDRERKR